MIRLPPGNDGRPWLDKAVHLCEYLAFSWLLLRAAIADRVMPSSAAARASMIAIGYGVALEGVQHFLPYRSADWHDIAMNTVGTGLGIGIGLAMRQR